MKVVQISTFDTYGGAARAAYRHHRALLAAGINSRMLVQGKFSDDATVDKPKRLLDKLRSRIWELDLLPLSVYPRRSSAPWSLAWLKGDILRRIEDEAPDLVHLHWIGRGFVPIAALPKFRRPIVWTLHDSWAFTGGCHIPGDCLKYRDSCGRCPQLGSNMDTDLSRLVWRRKRRRWGRLDMTVVAPSTWLAECARSSSLFRDRRVEVVPHGLDQQSFRPHDPTMAREILGLPRDKKIVLYGATTALTDPNKGFLMFCDAAKKLALDGFCPEVEIVVFGASTPLDPPNLHLKTSYAGVLCDDVTLSLLYSAADVFVAPSKQEAFGQTVLEAMACSTPTVAFDGSGISEMVIHKKTGYLATPSDSTDLAEGIAWVLNSDGLRRELASNARSRVEETFTSEKSALRYMALYEEILERGSRN
jgi:glycosyltransferase involved in cell wall biosynthesis